MLFDKLLLHCLPETGLLPPTLWQALPPEGQRVKKDEGRLPIHIMRAPNPAQPHQCSNNLAKSINPGRAPARLMGHRLLVPAPPG